jgi:GT2 family glycosyltransferase
MRATVNAPISVNTGDRTIVFVANHYANEAEVRTFVQHCAALELPAGWALEILVCDNSDSWTGDSPHPCATILRQGKNLGYYGGCAHALAHWRTMHGGAIPAWVGAVNTDLELDPMFFRTIVENVPTQYAVVAPAVQLPDGTHQNPYMHDRPSMARMAWMRMVFRTESTAWAWTLGHDLMRRVRPHSKKDGIRTRRQIYAPHGSIVMFRREFFSKGGKLEFGGFMYGEELHVAEQARQLGLSVLYEPMASVLHNAHSCVGKVPSKLNRKWRTDSSEFLWSAYFRPSMQR